VPTPPYRGWLSPNRDRNSASPTTTRVDKTRVFSPRSDTSGPLEPNHGSRGTPLVGVPLSLSADILSRPPETGPVRSLRGRQREASTARQRSRAAASSPERSAGANRRSHEVDQPEAAPCGPTRKGDRTRDDHREDRPDDAVRCGRRRSAVLYLTFVRTTQENRYAAIPGDTVTEGAEVRGARASWQLGAPSHPTDAPRWSR
jgi:hypothetical protein